MKTTHPKLQTATRKKSKELVINVNGLNGDIMSSVRSDFMFLTLLYLCN